MKSSILLTSVLIMLSFVPPPVSHVVAGCGQRAGDGRGGRVTVDGPHPEGRAAEAV